ncbi:MAG: thioredoxin-disulfide reductase [Candidatus Omnitrophota bacterium]
MHDLIIIGAGPAGLTAALYAGRFGLDTLVLEKMAVGGRILLSESIENFPGFVGGISTQELMERMRKQVEGLGIKIGDEEVLEIDCKAKTVKTTENNYSAKALIIAAGARPRKLGVPGEEKLTGRGVSYCATCDAPLYKEKSVVVVGGGDAVAEEALYLARFAKQLTIVHRRQDLRASAILQKRLKENSKIKFLLDSIVTEICGSTKVQSVKIKNTVTSEEKDFPCDGAFIFIGYEPETEFLKSKLKLDEKGFIITDETLATSQGGVFACGDCRRKSLYQVVTACGDGAVAADSAHKYITRSN